MLVMNTSWLYSLMAKKVQTSFIMTFKHECRVIIKLRSRHQWKSQLYQHQQSLYNISINNEKQLHQSHG